MSIIIVDRSFNALSVSYWEEFYGYSNEAQLLKHYQEGWMKRYPGWHALLETVTFDLLDTQSLNKRKMRGSDQFLHDPVVRANAFLNRFAHIHAGSSNVFVT